MEIFKLTETKKRDFYYIKSIPQLARIKKKKIKQRQKKNDKLGKTFAISITTKGLSPLGVCKNRGKTNKLIFKMSKRHENKVHGGAGGGGVHMAHKHRKRCSISLIIIEKRIKITLRYHFSSIQTGKSKRLKTHSVSKAVEKQTLASLWYKSYREKFSTL